MEHVEETQTVALIVRIIGLSRSFIMLINWLQAA